MSARMPDIQEELSTLKEVMEKLSPLEREYTEIKNRLKELRSKRREVINELQSLIDRIVENVNQQKELRKELLYTRQEYKIYKEERSKLIGRLRELREILRNRPRLPKPPDKIREELERLELIYETIHQDPKRERRLVEQINELSRYLKAYEEYQNAKREIQEVKKRLEELDLERFRNKIAELKENLNKIREEEITLKEDAKKIQDIKNKLDQEINELSKRLQELNEEMKDLREARNQILSKYGIKRVGTLSYEQIKKIILSKSEILQSALEKLEKGQSLSFEEFRELVKHGLI